MYKLPNHQICKLKEQEDTTYPSKLLKLKTDKSVFPNALFHCLNANA